MLCWKPVGTESLARLAARIRRGALEAVSPTRCAGCERPGELVCPDCLERFHLIDPRHSCLRCGAPHGDLVCTECTPREESGAGAECELWAGGPDRCLAVAEFAEPLSRMIRAYKDAGEQRLFGPFAEMLLDCAQHAERVAGERYGDVLSATDAIVFVPATAAAFRRRGFDHMEAIARHLSELAGIPLVDVLVKLGDADQRVLGRTGRQARARDAYRVLERVDERRILLLDDVITTGATIVAATRTLRGAGAVHVDALALARVLQ